MQWLKHINPSPLPKLVRFQPYWLCGNDSLYMSLVKISCAPISQQCCWQMENNPVRSHHAHRECSSVSLCWDNESGGKVLFYLWGLPSQLMALQVCSAVSPAGVQTGGLTQAPTWVKLLAAYVFFFPVVDIYCSSKKKSLCCFLLWSFI